VPVGRGDSSWSHNYGGYMDPKTGRVYATLREVREIG